MSEPPITFEKLLEHFPGVSDRGLKELAKRHNLGSRVGKKLFFYPSDIRDLMDATKQCPSKSSGAKGSPKSTALTAEAEYEKALALVTQRKRNGSSSKSSPDSTGPKSSEKPASQPSLRLVTST
jgi:hypothetical protein